MKELETVESFERAIQKETVVIDFYAPWCGPCKKLTPQLEKLSLQKEHATFYKVNVDNLSEIAEKWSIKSVPTVILFKNGTEKARTIGANINTDFYKDL